MQKDIVWCIFILYFRWLCYTWKPFYVNNPYHWVYSCKQEGLLNLCLSFFFPVMYVYKLHKRTLHMRIDFSFSRFLCSCSIVLVKYLFCHVCRKCNYYNTHRLCPLYRKWILFKLRIFCAFFIFLYVYFVQFMREKLGANLFYVNHFKEIILIKRNAEGNFHVALLKCVRKIYERSGLRKRLLPFLIRNV